MHMECNISYWFGMSKTLTDMYCKTARVCCQHWKRRTMLGMLDSCWCTCAPQTRLRVWRGMAIVLNDAHLVMEKSPIRTSSMYLKCSEININQDISSSRPCRYAHCLLVEYQGRSLLRLRPMACWLRLAPADWPSFTSRSDCEKIAAPLPVSFT